MDSLSDEVIYNITKYTNFKVRYVNKSFNKATKFKAINMIHKAFKGHVKKLEDAKKYPEIFKRHNLKNICKASSKCAARLALVCKQARYIIRKYVSVVLPYYNNNLPEPNLKLSIHLLYCFRHNSEIKVKHRDSRIYTATMLHAVRNYRDMMIKMPLSILLNEIHF